MLCPNGPSRPPCPPPRYGAHPHYLTAHSCMSFTSAVCIVALLVATINSAAVETRDPPCICLCLGVESGPGEESEGAVYPAFVPQCLPCRECLSRRAFTCDRGWVGRAGGGTERDEPAGLERGEGPGAPPVEDAGSVVRRTGVTAPSGLASSTLQG